MEKHLFIKELTLNTVFLTNLFYDNRLKSTLVIVKLKYL